MMTDENKLRSYLKQITPIAENYGKKGTIEKLTGVIDNIEKSTSVLLCGEFKRGKSSLVNAIIGADLCPTDIGIATSVITLIKYGSIKKAIRYYGDLLGDPNSFKKEEIEWSDIPKYTMGDISELDNTVLVELTYPSEFLKNGITLIDTPGLGGLDARHGVLTQLALTKADVIIYVTDAGEPLTQSELDFYKNEIATNGHINFVLVNKADILTKDVLTTHINNTKLQLAKFGTPKVIPVSAKCWNLYTELQDEELLLSSNKDEVLTNIFSYVDVFKNKRLKIIKDMVIAELKDISETISIEINQLQQDNNTKQTYISDLNNQLSDLHKFRHELNNPMSTIHLQINAIFDDARNATQSLISHEGTILTSTEFEALLEDESCFKDDGKWFVAQVNERIQNLSIKVDKHIKKAFEDISNSINKKIMNKTLENNSNLISDELKKSSIINSQFVFSLFGKITTSSTIGLIAFGLTQALIPGIGILVGIATASALIWKQISRESRQNRKNSLRQQLLPKVNLAITDIRNQTNDRFTKFHQKLLATIQELMTETEEKIKTIQSSILKNKDNEKELKEKLNHLNQKKQFCQTIVHQMNLLHSEPFQNAK